ncbi:MAG: response regulator [Deltaproteobacteria bacterium]|nr:response regulator [Deltaproteobacteria bacterium]MBW2238607.1 response regulator [Deltaproteobacteria bacterium]MBW2571568.1 response regulator [Deltaproteobacteria bacterium]MBW2670683.1 response regulator [Deltaproteobacteria bacterium]
MIVEDEAVIALRLEQRLIEMGYDVIGTICSGEAVVENARSFQPNLILMDIMLNGDLDGIDAAMIVKEELDIPIIFLTAYSDDKLIERAKKVDAFGYLVKPVRDRELKAAIEIALYKKKFEKELREREENFKSLVENANDGILIATRQYVLWRLGERQKNSLCSYKMLGNNW